MITYLQCQGLFLDMATGQISVKNISHSTCSETCDNKLALLYNLQVYIHRFR